MMPFISSSTIYDLVTEIQLADVDEYHKQVIEMADTIYGTIITVFGNSYPSKHITADTDVIKDTINAITNNSIVELSESQKSTLAVFMRDVGKKVLDKVNNEI